MKLVLIVCPLLCVLTNSAPPLQAQESFRIENLSLYSNRSPIIAIGRRGRLRIGRGPGSIEDKEIGSIKDKETKRRKPLKVPRFTSFNQEIESNSPFFVFKDVGDKLLVSSLQKAIHLERHGFWVKKEDCRIWASRVFFYPKAHKAIPRSFNALARVNESGRTWQNMRNGSFLGFPGLTEVTEKPRRVLYDFGILSAQDIVSEIAERKILVIEREDLYDTFVLFTNAELELAENRITQLMLTYNDWRDKFYKTAKTDDERRKERIKWKNALTDVRNNFAALGFVDVTLLNEWIYLESRSTIEEKPEFDLERPELKERCFAHADETVDKVIRPMRPSAYEEEKKDETKWKDLYHFTYQLFPGGVLKMGAREDFVWTEDERMLLEAKTDETIKEKEERERRVALLEKSKPSSQVMAVNATCFVVPMRELPEAARNLLLRKPELALPTIE